MPHPRLRAAIAAHLGQTGGRAVRDDQVDALIAEATAAFREAGYFDIDASLTTSGQGVRLGDELADTYLNRTDVAALIGVKPASLARYNLPAPDVVVGQGWRAARGWRASTIVRWHRSRPLAGE